MKRFYLPTLFFVIFVAGCAAYQSEGRKQFETNTAEFTGIDLGALGLFHCGDPVDIENEIENQEELLQQFEQTFPYYKAGQRAYLDNNGEFVYHLFFSKKEKHNLACFTKITNVNWPVDVELQAERLHLAIEKEEL